jgi:signal transduction histidine kinase
LTGKIKISNLHNAKKDEKSVSHEVSTSGKTLNYESFLLDKSGKQIPIHVYVRRVVFQDAPSLQWIFEDISERKELDRLREDMTAMIYHDLRSPLSNVVSSLDVLYNMFTDEEYETIASVLTIASRSTTRIQRLISSLLDINRLESGKAVGTQQEVYPSILLEDALDAVQAMAESRKQSITTDLSPNLPPVWVDADMIRRVLINLLENACKFSPAEGKIEVGAKANGNWLQMWVQDTGPGIPIEDQERIFEKYTRLKEKEGPAGLGVGLAFCRLAVEGHGGRIWVENKSNYGACFNLTLPFAKVASQVYQE